MQNRLNFVVPFPVGRLPYSIFNEFLASHASFFQHRCVQDLNASPTHFSSLSMQPPHRNARAPSPHTSVISISVTNSRLAHHPPYNPSTLSPKNTRVPSPSPLSVPTASQKQKRTVSPFFLEFVYAATSKQQCTISLSSFY